MFYHCEGCNRAYRNWFGFMGHWRAKHQGEDPPQKDEVQIESVPEGVEVSSTPVKEKVRTPPVPDIEELPTDPVDLLRTLLQVKGIGEEQAKRLAQEFRLSKWMWGDAQAMMRFLKGARLGVSSDWIESFLRSYGNAVEIPQDKGVEFLGSRRGRSEFFGRLGGEGEPSDPLSQYLKYQLYKEEREPKRDPALDNRITTLEQSMSELADVQRQTLDTLREREDRAREERAEQRIVKLEDRITALIESGGVHKGEQSEWLGAFLQEREKRYSEEKEHTNSLISELGQRLEEASKAVSQASTEARNSATRAVSEDRGRREEFKKELEGEGWSSRKKNIEERQMDIAENQLIPGVMGEARALRQTLEKVVGGGLPAVPSGPATPVSAEEADKLAEVMKIEQEIAQGAS